MFRFDLQGEPEPENAHAEKLMVFATHVPDDWERELRELSQSLSVVVDRDNDARDAWYRIADLEGYAGEGSPENIAARAERLKVNREGRISGNRLWSYVTEIDKLSHSFTLDDDLVRELYTHAPSFRLEMSEYGIPTSHLSREDVQLLKRHIATEESPWDGVLAKVYVDDGKPA